MIQLTRLNDRPLTVNSDLIKFVENAHDTVLTLINGEKVIVREDVQQVVERVIEFRRAVLAGLPVTGSNLGPAILLEAQNKEKPNNRDRQADRDAAREDFSREGEPAGGSRG